jgi:hypothetical protein
MEVWKAVFKTWTDDGPKIDEFLRQRLRPPSKHVMGDAGKVIIESPTRDTCFRTAEWLRHQNPLGKLLSYSIIGYEEEKVIYVSYCKLCREGMKGKHHEHSSSKNEPSAQNSHVHLQMP